MQLGDLVSAPDLDCLGDYLDNSRALAVLIELVEDASVCDRCLAHSLITDHYDFEAKVRCNP